MEVLLARSATVRWTRSHTLLHGAPARWARKKPQPCVSLFPAADAMAAALAPDNRPDLRRRLRAVLRRRIHAFLRFPLASLSESSRTTALDANDRPRRNLAAGLPARLRRRASFPAGHPCVLTFFDKERFYYLIVISLHPASA
jgi:hypothetical protein